jgi:hypothetical protein
MSSEDVYNWTVYGIACSLTGDVRYVGVTCNMKSRRGEHRREAKRGNKSRIYQWMQAMEGDGCPAHFLVLEEGSGYEAAADCERRWIAFYEPSGRLLNVRPGGEFVNTLDAYKATRNKASRERGLAAAKRNAEQQMLRRDAAILLPGESAGRAVVCLSTGERFGSVGECARKLGVDDKRVSQSCNKGYMCVGRVLAHEDDVKAGRLPPRRRTWPETLCHPL